MKRIFVGLLLTLTLGLSAQAQLPGITQPLLLGGGGALPVLSFTDHAVDATSQTTYTFTNKNIGTAAANRYVIVAAGGSNSPTSSTLNSVTVAGNSATSVVTANGFAGTITSPTGIFIYGPLPTGTTATITITFSGAMARAGIGIWTATGLNSATATATSSSTANPASTTINISANGFAIGYAIAVIGTSNTFTWTGLTKQFDQVQDSSTSQTGASDTFATAQSSRTVTATPNGTPISNSMVVAAFR